MSFINNAKIESKTMMRAVSVRTNHTDSFEETVKNDIFPSIRLGRVIMQKRFADKRVKSLLLFLVFASSMLANVAQAAIDITVGLNYHVIKNIPGLLNPAGIAVGAQSKALGYVVKNSAGILVVNSISRGLYNATTKSWVLPNTAVKDSNVAYFTQTVTKTTVAGKVVYNYGQPKWLNTQAAVVHSGNAAITNVVRSATTGLVTYRYKGSSWKSSTVQFSGTTVTLNCGTNICGGMGIGVTPYYVPFANIASFTWLSDRVSWTNSTAKCTPVINAVGEAVCSIKTPNNDIGGIVLTTKSGAKPFLYVNGADWLGAGGVVKQLPTSSLPGRFILGAYESSSFNYEGSKLTFDTGFDGLRAVPATTTYLVGHFDSDRTSVEGITNGLVAPMQKDAKGHYVFIFHNAASNAERPANDMPNSDKGFFYVTGKDSAGAVVKYYFSFVGDFRDFIPGTGVAMDGDKIVYGGYKPASLTFETASHTLDLRINADALEPFSKEPKKSEVVSVQIQNDFGDIFEAPLQSEANGNFFTRITVGTTDCGRIRLKLASGAFSYLYGVGSLVTLSSVTHAGDNRVCFGS